MDQFRSIRVLYHCPCPDGIYAALAAYLRFSGCPNIELKFIPHSTFIPLPFVEENLFSANNEVYLLDYCGPNNFISRISKIVKRVILIDHHKTAEEQINNLESQNNKPPNLEVFMRMDMSGATLAWEYFDKEKKLLNDDLKKRSELQQFYRYIEDNDLWKKELPLTNNFKNGFGYLQLDYDINSNPKIFDQILNLKFDEVVEAGRKITDEKNSEIEEEIKNSFEIKLGLDQNNNALFGNCLAVITKLAQYRSDMGNILAIKSNSLGLRGIGAVCYKEPKMDESLIKISLRSIDDEDTTQISQHYEGGGHKHASSFTIKENEFVQWKNNTS